MATDVKQQTDKDQSEATSLNMTEIAKNKPARSWSSWLGWFGVYILFFALPLGILFDGYRIYSESQVVDAKERLIQYYSRELASLRNHVSNERVLKQLFQSFKESYLQNYTNSEKLQRVISNSLQELPASASLIIWNSSGTVSIAGAPLPEADALVKLLLRGHAHYSKGVTALLTESGELEKEIEMYKKTLERIIGKGFSLQAFVSAPGKIYSGENSTAPTLLYWDFLHSKSGSLGGFLFIIPSKSLSETFGLSYILSLDQTANPEFSIGFANIEDPKMFKISYLALEPLAKRFFNQYRFSLESPIIDNDWFFIVLPLSDISAIRLFTIFSVRRYRNEMENSVSNGLYATIFLLMIGAIMFFRAYQRSHTTGLSIKVKMVGLFLFSMFLPLSLLVLLALHYSFDHTKILSNEAGDKLVRELKRLDENIVEFQRIKTNQWATLKNLPEVRSLDKSKLLETGKSFREKNLLERLYLVDASGTLCFDQDYLFGDSGRQAFMCELGRRAIELYVLTQDKTLGYNVEERFNQDLITQLAAQCGQLQQIVLPGTSSKVYLFIDLVLREGTASIDKKNLLALIVTMDKMAFDREYLTEAIRNQLRKDPELHFIALNREDITDTIPILPPVFKANLLPLISTLQVQDITEPERLYNGERYLLAAMRQGRLIENFLLGAHLDYDQVVDPINRMYSFIAVALMLGFLGSLTLAAVLGRNFINPIATLSQGTRAIACGDLTKLLPVETRDELGELSQAFNDMTRRLRSRLTELTVLYNLTQKASTSHNQREVFDLAAKNLKDHLGAADSGTAWINEGEGKENLYLDANRDATIATIIRKTLSEAIKKRNLHFDSFLPPNSGGILGIPLFYEEKEFGGLYLIFKQNLIRNGQLVLSQEERSFIETLRHHLSLIIEKQRLFEQAITDGLTRLYVRRFFLATLEKELARARRYKTDLCFLLMDIDHFKKFNDTYGHQIGDLVLRETAQRIIESIRAVDYPGRYGGEEIAVILPQTSLKDGLLVAERIRRHIESVKYTHNNLNLAVTVSIGITALVGRNLTIEEFIAEVDKALYQAKAQGRNRVVVAEGLLQSDNQVNPTIDSKESFKEIPQSS